MLDLEAPLTASPQTSSTCNQRSVSPNPTPTCNQNCEEEESDIKCKVDEGCDMRGAVFERKERMRRERKRIVTRRVRWSLTHEMATVVVKLRHWERRRGAARRGGAEVAEETRSNGNGDVI